MITEALRSARGSGGGPPRLDHKRTRSFVDAVRGQNLSRRDLGRRRLFPQGDRSIVGLGMSMRAIRFALGRIRGTTRRNDIPHQEHADSLPLLRERAGPSSPHHTHLIYIKCLTSRSPLFSCNWLSALSLSTRSFQTVQPNDLTIGCGWTLENGPDTTHQRWPCGRARRSTSKPEVSPENHQDK